MVTIPPGSTSQSIDVKFFDSTGQPFDDLVVADVPSIYYSFGGSIASSSLVLHDLSDESDPYSSGGFLFRRLGTYRLDLPNSWFNIAVTARRIISLMFDVSNSPGIHLVHPGIEVRNDSIAPTVRTSVTNVRGSD